MNNSHAFPCPNCGSYGTRRYFVSKDAMHRSCPDRQVMTTECSICDYLMTMCSLDGRVIETSSSPFAIANAPAKLFAKTPVKLSVKKEKSAIEQKIVAFSSKRSA